MLSTSGLVIASEIALALYPILIKTVPTDLFTQIVARFLTFSVLAAALASPAGLSIAWGSPGAALRSAGLGLLSLSHVAVSYYAFQQLPAGVAMSLFYTYPFWNIVAGVLGFGESVTARMLGLLAVAFVGTVLVSSTAEEEGQEGTESRTIHWKGVLAGLAAAATETAMYFAVKTTEFANPYTSILELYPGAFLGLIPLILQRGGIASLDLRWSTWLPMLLFNALIGFVGYAVRFYTIPKLDTAVFSLLTFVGVVASFVWGLLLAKEKPTSMTMVGAGLISAAAAFVPKSYL
jgi:drug/metabolite transporter (DMT)-like permease